jgi:hypothetical protein
MLLIVTVRDLGPLCGLLCEFCARCDPHTVLAARSAAEDTGNQPRALWDIKGTALGWLLQASR